MARFIATQQTSLTKKTTQLRAMANNAIDEIKKVVEEVADEVIEDAVSNYESAAIGESYIRTGRLGESWTRSNAYEHNGEIIVIINNFVSELDRDDSGKKGYGRHYAGLVQGDERTNRHELAGWLTIFEIQQFHSNEQGNKVRTAIRRAGSK